MLKKRLLILVMLFLLPINAIADVLILIPGYLSGGHAWRTHGITQNLIANGWSDGGNFILGPNGVRLDLPPATSSHRFYTVELPNEAPLPLQAGYINSYIDAVRIMHPEDKLILVGHSAGGVLGRYIMVSRPSVKIDTLITIASPHSGSDAAELGEAISNSPASWVAPLFGLNTLNRSRGLYRDLGRPDAGNLLGWLNTRQHPKARYVSIIHLNDELVDAGSQDMNNVPPLASQSIVLTSDSGHELNPVDGVLLVNILAKQN
ncbi:MAG: hypothetical protein KAT25_00380 [Sulfuriflexus sp.]|nr:hypothetical protein [Sulfuriflexus sp.]